MNKPQRDSCVVCVYYDFMGSAAKQLEFESMKQNCDIDDTQVYSLKEIPDLDNRYENKFSTISVVFGYFIARNNPRVEFQTDNAILEYDSVVLFSSFKPNY